MLSVHCKLKRSKQAALSYRLTLCEHAIRKVLSETAFSHDERCGSQSMIFRAATPNHGQRDGEGASHVSV